jgi:hypothetical protein
VNRHLLHGNRFVVIQSECKSETDWIRAWVDDTRKARCNRPRHLCVVRQIITNWGVVLDGFLDLELDQLGLHLQRRDINVNIKHLFVQYLPNANSSGVITYEHHHVVWYSCVLRWRYD